MPRGSLAVLLLLGAALGGCSRAPSPEAAYAAAWKSFRQGQLEEAQKSTEAALRVYRGDRSAPIASQLRLLEAESLLAQSRVRDARVLLDRPDASDPALHLRWLADQAEASAKSGDIDTALRTLDEVDRAAPAPSDAVFKGRLLRSNILARGDRLQAAEELLSQTASQAAAAGDIYNQAAALANLSTCKIWEDRFDESVEFGRTALELAAQVHAGRLEAIANDNLGVAYGALGDLDRSEQHQNQAIQQLREIGDQRSLAASFGALGYLYLRRHDVDKASEAFQNAARISGAIEDFENAGKWTGRVAYALTQKGDWNAAESWNQKAYALYRKLRVPQNPGFLKLATAAVSAGRGKIEDAGRTYAELIAAAQGGDPFVELSARLNYAELLARQQKYPEANREFEQGLATIERTASSLNRDDYRFTYYDVENEFYRAYVDLLVTEKQEAQALKVADYSRARVLTQRLGVPSRSIDQIQPAAFEDFARRSGAVLLSYWLGPVRSFVWVIQAGGIRLQELPGEERIGELIRDYQRILIDDQRDPVAAGLSQGERLRETLLGPVERDLAGARRVVIVPDGALYALNFETLPDAAGGHYWIEDAEVSVAPSLTLLNEPPRRIAAKPSLLVLGAPEAVNPAYPALPEAQSEIAGIQGVFADAEVYTGTAATPDRFLASDPARFTLIHFAAHAEANRASPLDSAVILSPDRPGGGYKLYARDIARQKLSAELVTLSGCRSAGARTYGGEGIVGFAWAFLESGAHSVIAGLWDVSDSASSRLMNQLYAALASGQPPPEALRRTKLAMLRSTGAFRKPFYWAPYQIYIR